MPHHRCRNPYKVPLKWIWIAALITYRWKLFGSHGQNRIILVEGSAQWNCVDISFGLAAKGFFLGKRIKTCWHCSNQRDEKTIDEKEVWPIAVPVWKKHMTNKRYALQNPHYCSIRLVKSLFFVYIFPNRFLPFNQRSMCVSSQKNNSYGTWALLSARDLAPKFQLFSFIWNNFSSSIAKSSLKSKEPQCKAFA